MASAEVIPTMRGWIGKANRESETAPVLVFREALQALGLLQNRKGVLRLTRAGRVAQQTQGALWNHLADRLVPSAGGFDTDATLLVLAFAAASSGAELDIELIAAALSQLGWRAGNDQLVEGYDLYALTAVDVLWNVGGEVGPVSRWRVSPVAAQLARDALRRT